MIGLETGARLLACCCLSLYQWWEYSKILRNSSNTPHERLHDKKEVYHCKQQRRQRLWADLWALNFTASELSGSLFQRIKRSWSLCSSPPTVHFYYIQPKPPVIGQIVTTKTCFHARNKMDGFLSWVLAHSFVPNSIRESSISSRERLLKIAKNFDLSASTEQNVVKRFREFEEICKG